MASFAKLSNLRSLPSILNLSVIQMIKNKFIQMPGKIHTTCDSCLVENLIYLPIADDSTNLQKTCLHREKKTSLKKKS